ncbi:unnamed protein product [Callosobruchus maculatus]|uniref:PID domain-containing protein n=1 Tax=Callosobruchus maculatus TaxID=64391 RepID=A0A653CWU0_CALMS|nr:unnamed protein product [Callosobruchus maculatus]
MAQDTTDSAPRVPCTNSGLKRVSCSIETLHSEMHSKEMTRERGKRAIKRLLNVIRLKKYACATISRPDPTYKVAYLGNVITGWAKGEGCFDKPLTTLWRNYTQSSRPDVRMQLTVCGGGLRATTKDHGITEYWSHRLTACTAPEQYPRLFCWIYRHEVRRMKHELRCHAVLCSTAAVAKQIEEELKQSIALALLEFKRDKLSRQNARLSLVNSVYENPTLPRRKILLSTGPHNYKPPLERSKSAPKLTSIEEIIEEEDEVIPKSDKIFKEIISRCESTSSLVYRLNKMNKTRYICDKKQTKENVEEISMDKKTDMILEELVQCSLSSDLVESCEKAWYNALMAKPDLLPAESDEGSLSSGCDSVGAATDERSICMESISENINEFVSENKTDLDFKVGGIVMSRISNYERLASGSPDLINYCGIKMYSKRMPLDHHESVSLVPVGESNDNFSSLKIFKTRNPDPVNNSSFEDKLHNEEDETVSACSDESGFEEEELVSSVANIVLV